MFACLYRPPQSEPVADHPGTGGTPADPSTLRPAPPPNALVAIAREFSPRYEVHADDLVVVDVAGLERLLGPPFVIGDELRRAASVRRLRVHVAIASTCTAATILARVRPGLTIIERGAEAAALAPIALDILEKVPSSVLSSEFPVESFRRWGVKTLGELAALPAPDLVARMGRPALAWQAIARGEDRRPLVPTLDEERFESTLALEWPIEGLEPLSFVLTRLLEPLSTRLERRDRGAAVLHVILDLVTRERHVRRLELPTPMREVRALRTLALLDLESHPPAAPVDRVTIVIDPTPGRVMQNRLFARAHPAPEQIATLLARLVAVMGHDRVGAPAAVDSHRPGAFEMKPFACADHARPPRANGGRDVPPRERTWQGPSALPPQEPTPDGLGAGSAAVIPFPQALRRCRQPVPARVAVTDGRPVRVSSDRRGFTGGSVVRSAGPWRTSGGWWNTGSAWNREEWDVALSDGSVFRVFLDRETDGWFIEAIVD